MDINRLNINLPAYGALKPFDQVSGKADGSVIHVPDQRITNDDILEIIVNQNLHLPELIFTMEEIVVSEQEVPGMSREEFIDNFRQLQYFHQTTNTPEIVQDQNDWADSLNPGAELDPVRDYFKDYWNSYIEQMNQQGEDFDEERHMQEYYNDQLRQQELFDQLDEYLKPEILPDDKEDTFIPDQIEPLKNMEYDPLLDIIC